MMQSRSHARVGFEIVSAIVIVGAYLLIVSKLHSQTTAPHGVPDRVSQLAGQKMEVSKLDWILLTARVRTLEQVIAHESSRPVSAAGMRYDPESKVVVINAFVDQKWLRSANLDILKAMLDDQGTNYCVQGLALAEAEAGEVLAAGNVGKDCSVSFFTMTTDQAGHLTRKEVATDEGGRLILK